MAKTPFKAIKITPKNSAEVNAALRAVNGLVKAHLIQQYSEIAEAAEAAEAAVVALAGSREQAVGAAAASKAHFRVAAKFVLERRPSGWFLVAAHPEITYRQGGGARQVNSLRTVTA